MALENFKYYKIKLNRADMTIATPLTAKEGAVNGNGIELQIINGSILEDTTNVAVYLNWKHQITGVEGSEPFTLVDAATGTYRVSYPTEMLTQGSVRADLKVVDGTSVTVSTTELLIKVAQSATNSTTQSENAWNDIQTILVSQQQLKDLFTQAITGATVDSEVITARQSTLKGKTFATLDERLEEAEGDAAVMATNLVPNAGFSNGTTGWWGYQSTIAIDGSFLKATTSGASPSIYTPSLIPMNSKIYVKAEMKTPLAGRTFQIKLGANGTSNVTSVADTFVVVSGIITSPTNNPNIDHNMRGHAIGEAYFIKDDSAISINLTALFGAGNEPTKEQMDWLLSQFPNGWFNGTQPIISALDLYKGKADKQQEPWITPTLLNGATQHLTRPLQYRKTSYGNLQLRGETNNTPAYPTVIFTLPVGYRPMQTTNVIGNRLNAFSNINIETSGNVYASGTAVTFFIYTGVDVPLT